MDSQAYLADVLIVDDTPDNIQPLLNFLSCKKLSHSPIHQRSSYADCRSDPCARSDFAKYQYVGIGGLRGLPATQAKSPNAIDSDYLY